MEVMQSPGTVGRKQWRTCLRSRLEVTVDTVERTWVLEELPGCQA